jgi:hypothetical protein
MNPIITIPYHAKDAELVKRLLDWISTLQPYPHVSALLACDASVPVGVRTELNYKARQMFRYAETMIVNVPEHNQGWPRGANWMFHEVSRQCQECYRTDFLWLEPDAVPLKQDWYNDLIFAYKHCPKKFMGYLVKTDQPNVPPVHMAGVGFYPQDAHSSMKEFCVGSEPFDLAAANHIYPARVVETKLIYELWGDHDSVPTFGTAKTADNVITLDAIPKEAVLFHRCKDESLINLLRAPLKPTTEGIIEGVTTLPEHPPVDLEFPKPKRGPGRPKKPEPEMAVK